MLSEETTNKLLSSSKKFEKHMHRHPGMQWKDVQARLEANPDKLISLNEMDITDGEPDVVDRKQIPALSSSWIVLPKVRREDEASATIPMPWNPERNTNRRTAHRNGS